MRLFNILGHKYTKEKIDEALKEWTEYSEKEPALHSIESRLINKSSADQTNIIIYRKYPINNILRFPNHYYLTINDKIWHPGYGDDDNIFQTEISNENDIYHNSVIEIKEKCNYCAYWELYNNFEGDRHFNIMVNNCQVIMGMFAETICIIVIIVSLITTTFTGYYVTMLIAIFVFLVLFVFSILTYRREKVSFSVCRHIISIRKY